jgi:hypothetical protein
MPGFNARSGAFQAAVIPFVAFPFNSLCQFSPAHPRPAVGFDIVWSRKCGIAVIGLIFFTVALVRFRRTVAVS